MRSSFSRNSHRVAAVVKTRRSCSRSGVAGLTWESVDGERYSSVNRESVRMRILALVEGSGLCGVPRLLPVCEQITDLLAGADTQLPQDFAHVGAHGALGKPESFCDLGIGQTSGDKERHFLLATAEGDVLRSAGR